MHHGEGSLNRVAFAATVHCLTGCAIGEVLGMIIGTALGWSDWQTIALAVGLAFLFGYSFTLVPLLRGGLALAAALPIAFAADTISITIMEVVDNAIMLAHPRRDGGRPDEPPLLGEPRVRPAGRGVAAYPVNRWLIARGRGHAVVHAHH